MTNAGELVKIELSGGTGQVELVGADTLGWTGLSFDPAGALFATSRVLSQQDLFQHLYRIDSATGGFIADLGSMGTVRLADVTFAAGTLYGNVWDLPCDCGGQLITIDTADAAIDFVTGSGGFGLNPFDTIEGLHIHRGGLAVHPVSGDLWGIEAAGSHAPVVYRINATTGAADSTLLLGLNGNPLPFSFGFDGLAILGDGTFIAVKGVPNAHPDSILYAFEPTPDSLDLVELHLIPLSYDTALAGKINGLTLAIEDAPPPTLNLSAASVELHPWIQTTTFTFNDTLFRQPERVGDTVTVTVFAASGDSPMSDLEIEVRAEMLDSTGGHTHLQAPLAFENAPTASFGGGTRPITGYFKQGLNRMPSLTDTTGAQGEITFAFVARFVGGEVEIIAGANLGGIDTADTLRLTLRVSGLVDVQDATSDAYFVGGTIDTTYNPDLPLHPQDSIWFATGGFRESLALVVSDMKLTGPNRYIQVNDNSLPYGGSFSVAPDTATTGQRVDAPFRPHRSHSLGIDADLSFCYATTAGEDGQVHRVFRPCLPGQTVNYGLLRQSVASRGLRVMREGDHFHVRDTANTIVEGP